MFDVTPWVVHVTREPSDDFLSRMDRRWRDGLERGAATGCGWKAHPLHSLVLLHVDRAAHKRRLRSEYFAGGDCRVTGGHGFTPMSDLMPADMYGPEPAAITHTGDESALATAFAAARDNAYLIATTVLTEAEFVAVDSYDEHSASQVRPESHGVVLPVMYADAAESDEDALGREDLLRANGFASYIVDAVLDEQTPLDLHRNLACLMEDILDEVAHLKADAAARILTQDALWPIVIVRAPQTWAPHQPAEAPLQRRAS